MLWAEETTDIQLQVGDVYPIKNEMNREEYAISYYCGAMPYGYIVLEKIGEDWVAREFSISKGCEGIYTNLVESVQQEEENVKDISIETELYEIEPMQYAVKVKNKKDKNCKMYDSYGNSYMETGVYQ